jgi:peptidoglycan/xylan/chitin deacetylase (PgdA/CDA1 family)
MIIIIIIISYIIVPSNSFSQEIENNTIKCNCVAFRMDDIQDNEFRLGQITPMDIFILKNQSLTLGLIMSLIGNDSKVIDKVREGSHMRLFELALHGWNHSDYTDLNQEQQKNSLYKANEKMQTLFGSISDIFIPPEGEFNNDTLKAMNQSGLRILSSGIWAEENFDRRESIFNASNIKDYYNETLNHRIYHLPATVSFKDYENGKWIKNSNENIINNATNNIDKYGYAIIVIHPQDFLRIKDEKFVDMLDINQINDLALLINSILSRNINITSYSKILGIEPKM